MSDIKSILNEIDALKGKLNEKYSRKVTIMFTDLKDSTVFFEKFGDMNGRMLIEKHNSILFPIVEKYGGVIIKTIGDAIMARYDFALSAVRASIEMQRALQEYNKTARDKIRIRVGVHTGVAIVEENDVFGDAVNLAARIEAGTEPEFITISKNTLKEIASYKNIQVDPLGVVKYKGKEEEIETFSVLWDRSILNRKVRGEKEWKRDSLRLNLSLYGSKVKIRYNYYLNDVEQEEVFSNIDKKIFHKFFEFLEQLRSSTLQQNTSLFDLSLFKEEGKKVYDALFSATINEIFKKGDLKYLVIDYDDNFSFFPLDLIYDGQTFLGLKYPIFRLINHTSETSQSFDPSFAFLDYTLDEEVSQGKEYEIITKTFQEANLRLYAPKKEYTKLDTFNKKFKEINKDYSHLHFAFHNLFSINFDNIKLNNKVIEYKNLAGINDTLKYVIANSCKTVPLLSKFIKRENNFLSFLNHTNLKVYIGNFFNIYDEVGVYFSELFYDFMLKGYAYPESIFKAKLALKERYGEDSLIWSSYTIFTDSVETVLEEMIEHVTEKQKIRGNLDATMDGSVESVLRKSDETEATPTPKNNNKMMLSVLFLVVVALAVYLGITALNKKDPNKKNLAVMTEQEKEKSSSTSKAIKQKAAKEQLNQAIKQATKETETKNMLTYDGVTKDDLRVDTKNDAVAMKNPNTENQAKEKNYRMVVLHFDNNSNNKKLDPLRKALADMLIADVSDIEGIKVVEREKLEDIIKELNLSRTKYIKKSTALKIGRMLSAKYIMIGSFIDPPIQGLPLRVDAKIIDVETSEIKWAKGVTGEKKALYDIEKKIVNKLKDSSFIKALNKK